MSEAVSQTGWTCVTFGDVVQLSRERSSDPEDDGFERYVGLEHIEPGDLKIRRWGDIADGTTFTNVFRSGQVLFGKRRAYQRKVAVADFDGVCSGDIYVLEPKNAHLLPELLPFICQTNEFFDHAVGTSAGSLSPRTNWESLASYQFALPPLEEQRRIAALLNAARVAVEHLQNTMDATSALYSAAGAERFARLGALGIQPVEWKRLGWVCERLEDLVVSSAPICYGIVQVRDHDPTGVPTLAIKDLDGDFSGGVHRTAASIETRYARSRVEPGDLLLSIKATIGEVLIVPDGFNGNISRDIARLRLNATKIRPRFFLHLYRSTRYTGYVRSLLVGSTRAELSIGVLRQMAVPFPPPSEQDQLVDEMDALLHLKRDLAKRVAEAFGLTRQILDAALPLRGSRE